MYSFEYFFFLGTIVVTVPFLFIKKNYYIRAAVLVLSLALFGFLQWSCPRPSGAIEQFIADMTKGRYLYAHLFKVLGILGFAALFGRYFCGWICPKGTLQEYLFSERGKWKVPNKIDKALRLIKFIILALMLILPITNEFKLMKHMGPFKVLFNLEGETYLVIYLGLVLFSSIFIQRPFCKYFCPFGALLNLFGRFSLFKMIINKSNCTNCMRCTKTCVMDCMEIKNDVMAIDHKECIMCGNCSYTCTLDASNIKFNTKG